MKLDARWFCIFIWTIIVVGCVTDKAIVGYYRIEQSAKIAENNMKQMVDTLKQ